MKLLSGQHWKDPDKLGFGKPSINCNGSTYISDWGMVPNLGKPGKNEKVRLRTANKCETETFCLSFNLEPIEITFQQCNFKAFEYIYPDFKDRIHKIVDMVIAHSFPEEKNNIFFKRGDYCPSSLEEGLFECVTYHEFGAYFRRVDWKHLPKFFEYVSELNKHEFKNSHYYKSLASFDKQNFWFFERIHEINAKGVHPLGINKQKDIPKVGYIDNIIKYFSL